MTLLVQGAALRQAVQGGDGGLYPGDWDTWTVYLGQSHPLISILRRSLWQFCKEQMVIDKSRETG